MRFFLYLKHIFWVWWSNHYYKKHGAELHSTEIDPKDNVKDLQYVRWMVERLYKTFEYTKDSAELLGDAIIPPCEAYKKYKEGKLKDDCDGFHSLVYHCLKQSGFKTYLLTANTGKNGHCVTTFRYMGLWYVVDYNEIYGSCRRLEPSVQEFNDYYSKKYCNNKKVIYNALLEYDYEQGKFVLLNNKKTFYEN